MIEFKDDKGKLLPKKVQKRVNDFIDHLKDVSWFKPSADLKQVEVDKQIKFTLKCFGIKAEIEYRKLSTPKDRASARDSARASARDSARASAQASIEVLLDDDKDFKKKYPNGVFIQLFKLREMWLYPVWVLDENKKFVVYIPPVNMDFPKDFI